MIRANHPITRIIVLGLLTFAAAAAGCSSDPDPTPPVEDEPPIANTWVDQDPSLQGDGTLNPVLEGRAPKRLTVDQLRRVVPQVTDGHTWHQALGAPGQLPFLIPMFDLLGPTLGEADYLTTSVNFLDPIPSFVKYVDEMASTVCLSPIFDPENDSIVKYPEDVDQNLRYLRLKFHGIHVPEGSMEGLEGLRQLYDTLYADYFDHENAAYRELPWVGVCVAVMTDPEFYIY